MTRGILGLVLLAASPGVLLTQDARMDRIREAFPAETVTEIEGILTRAEAAGVPTGPLLDKALEGAAKRVPPDRVVTAISSYAGRLGEARSMIGLDRSTMDVMAGADAVRRGVPPATVRTLAQEHHGELTVPLVVMGDLVEAGVPADHAYRVVRNALEKEHTSDEMLAIPWAVRRLMHEGQSADQAAGMVGRWIGSGDFNHMIGPQGRGWGMPPAGAPVPPGSQPPDHMGRERERGKGKGHNRPPGG